MISCWRTAQSLGSNVPLWVPRAISYVPLRATFRRALDEGLRYRPLADTIRDTLLWDQVVRPISERRAGLSPVQERNLLTAWHTRAVEST